MVTNKPITTDYGYTSADYTNNTKPTTQSKENVEEKKTETPAAVLELNKEKTEDVTYKKPGKHKVDRAVVDKMIADNNHRMEQFKNLIRTLISKQGGTVEAALSGNFKLKIDEETRAAAKEAISEDGEFGVAKTAERIVSFAKAISGGDVTKLDKLKKAIDKGFDEAERILGELPDISKETYKEVMRQLDEWASGTDKAENK